MYRIACLRIPRFQIVVHQKHEPELKNKAFVLLADANKPVETVNLSRSRVFMCSAQASKHNVVASMKWTEAKSHCANLTWRQCDHKLYKEAQNKVVTELVACSPRVSAREPGIFILDASGMQRMGGENKLCRDLLKLVSRLGYTEGQVGIADSAFAALIATRFKKRWHIVPEGGDTNFLKPLSINHLALDYDSHDMFVDLGLKSMGDFAQLSMNSVAERFGNEIARTQQLVLGFDQIQPQVPTSEKQFNAAIEVGGAMESLNETLFLLKSLLDKITSQLKLEGYCAEELLVQFFNDDEKFDERTIKLVRPSNNTKFLLEVIRLSVEARQLKREYTAIKISVSRFGNENYEQSTIRPEDRENANALKSQNNLLQKFITRLGEDTLVRPLANDQYAPEKAGIWVPIFKPVKTNSINSELNLHGDVYAQPIDEQYIRAKQGSRGLVSGLVLRQVTSPISVFVQFEDRIPVAVAYGGQWHLILKITKPECLSGLWWDEPFRKSYYQALIKPKYGYGDSMLVQLVHDHDKQSWFVEGIFD